MLDRCLIEWSSAGALSLGEGANADLAGILDVYFHEDHPERILFAGPAYYHWITSDYGHTFTKVWTSDLDPDGRDSQHVLKQSIAEIYVFERVRDCITS